MNFDSSEGNLISESCSLGAAKVSLQIDYRLGTNINGYCGSDPSPIIALTIDGVEYLSTKDSPTNAFDVTCNDFQYSISSLVYDEKAGSITLQVSNLSGNPAPSQSVIQVRAK